MSAPGFNGGDPSRAPRLAPANRREAGWLNARILDLLRRGARTRRPPNLFATLARHRRLFRGWLLFAGALMPRGVLPRSDTELVILRVAHNSGCEYEWRHHERLGRAAGLSAATIERVREGPDASGWGRREQLLLRCA
ncbi:MAG TPA: carboxymuconolactone decarboxylase family protein, partial [Solirubrobacteraceae bacterium]|nr:carboxymuconolactone decarboxylase family protein [Solirubrobacteraceae bacterium]